MLSLYGTAASGLSRYRILLNTGFGVDMHVLHTGIDPMTGEDVYVPRDHEEQEIIQEVPSAVLGTGKCRNSKKSTYQAGREI